MEVEFRLPLGKLMGVSSAPRNGISSNHNHQQNSNTNSSNHNNTITIKGNGISEPTTKVNVNVGSVLNRIPRPNPSSTTTTTIHLDQRHQPPTPTEVKTTVNHNGTIETHFDCSDDSQPKSNRVEIQLEGVNPQTTNVFLINKKSGERELMTRNSNSRSTTPKNEPKTYRKISDIGLYRNHSNPIPVRVTDICKDSDEEFM